MSGIVKTGQSVTAMFTTSLASTGAASNADSTPTGTLYVNGTANGATVTVTNVTTGRYKAAVTLPTLSAGDVVDLHIAATVSTVAGGGVVWSAIGDTYRISDSTPQTGDAYARIGAAGAGLTAVGDTRMANLDATVSSRATVSGVWSGITATAARVIADHVLRRSWASASASSDGDTLSFRSLLGAVAKLVNRVAISSSTLTVYKDDDTTSLGTQTVGTDDAAVPIVSVNTD